MRLARTVEVHNIKWPDRRLGITRATLLGEDRYGRWLGIPAGTPWWMPDRSDSGVFAADIVKLIPEHTYWSACFQPVDPVVDVDIILPVHWRDDIVEEIDLELDILRAADGTVCIKDRDEFDRVCTLYHLPDDIAEHALATCEEIHARVERHDEPFGEVGRSWLDRLTSSPSTSRVTH